jgi:hypothetical protein
LHECDEFLKKGPGTFDHNCLPAYKKPIRELLRGRFCGWLASPDGFVIPVAEKKGLHSVPAPGVFQILLPTGLLLTAAKRPAIMHATGDEDSPEFDFR